MSEKDHFPEISPFEIDQIDADRELSAIQAELPVMR